MLRRVVLPRALATLAVALTFAVPASAVGKGPTRFSLAGGCYSLRSAPHGTVVKGANKLRMQATTLGRYLLYTPARKVLAAQDDGSVIPVETPSPAADWRVANAVGGAFRLAPHSQVDHGLAVGRGGAPTLVAGRGARLRFFPAKGCARYPEASLSASGKPSKGMTPYGRVGGFLEGHQHWMNFEFLGGDFQCGRPWHPYGIPYAFPDCSSVEGPQGTAAPVQNFLNFGQPAAPHDTSGWPKMTEWGNHNLTYNGVYWRWVERAWMAGTRLMVVTANENRVLCELLPQRRNTCDEMATARLEFRDMRELQRYVDAQAGGPGKGFFQIVTNPFQARRVINQGKMAVVLEIEVSEPFGCAGLEDHSSCDKAQIKRQLDQMYGLGVRSSLLLNKFDNPLTGVRFDGGPVGVLINAGNKRSAGSFWSAKTCTGKLHDNTIETFEPQSSATLNAILATLGVTSGQVPAYPPAPHCNTRGLTDLGAYLERLMMRKHMIINPDHMSQAGVADTLTLLEAHRYSGVISPHGWMDPGNWPRIWKLGGVAFPGHSTATSYLDDYRKYRPRQTPYLFGWGYGADLGGLSAQPDAPEDKHAVRYPFRSYDGSVTFRRQRTGERVFDYNKEGVAHYGLYADWLNDLQRQGGQRFRRDMWNGAEAYLEMWERASGIPTPGCRAPHGRVNGRGLPKLRLGAGWRKLLRGAGQPQQRNRAWSWCVRGKGNRNAADVAELSPNGAVELVASTGRGRSAAGVPIGASASALGGAAPLGGGVFVRRVGNAVFAYALRGSHVGTVAVASRRLAASPARLRSALHRARMARATQAEPSFVPNPRAKAARLSGTGLAGTSDPRLNHALVMLCQLGG